MTNAHTAEDRKQAIAFLIHAIKNLSQNEEFLEEGQAKAGERDRDKLELMVIGGGLKALHILGVSNNEAMEAVFGPKTSDVLRKARLIADMLGINLNVKVDNANDTDEPIIPAHIEELYK